MEPKRIIELTVGIVVALVVFSAILMPVISNAQTNNGDPITLTNDSPVVLREVKPGDVLIGTRSTVDGVTDDVWTLNGETVVGPTGGADRWNVGIMSDGLYVQINAPANSAMGIRYSMTTATPTVVYMSGGSGSATHSFTFGEDTISVVASTADPVEVPYTWAYVMCPYGEGEYCAPIAGGVGIVKDPNQVILCGAYTSGDLDTMYYYKDGQTYVSNTDYTMTADITTAVHEGTTDIYDATVSVAMTDGTNTETFTPYRILVPYEVTGHADSGAIYDMLGVIPILIIAGLIVGIVGVAISRRE